jgi:hypothetical protein
MLLERKEEIGEAKAYGMFAVLRHCLAQRNAAAQAASSGT